MIRLQRRDCCTLLLLGLTILPAASVQAATFNFAEGGFAETGQLFGTFSAPDASLEQPILKSDLTTFSLTWSGNALIPTFTTTLADLLTDPTSRFCFGNTCDPSTSQTTSLGKLNIVTSNDFTKNRRAGIGSVEYLADSSVVNQVGGVIDASVPGYTGLPDSPGILLSIDPVEIQQTSLAAVPEPSNVVGVVIAGLFLAQSFRRRQATTMDAKLPC